MDYDYHDLEYELPPHAVFMTECFVPDGCPAADEDRIRRQAVAGLAAQFLWMVQPGEGYAAVRLAGPDDTLVPGGLMARYVLHVLRGTYAIARPSRN